MCKLYIFKRNKLEKVIEGDEGLLLNYLWHGGIIGLVVNEKNEVLMWHKKALSLYENLEK